MKENHQKTNGGSAEAGVITIICPHYQRCKYGAVKSSKSRHRCYGKLYKISQWEARIFIAFKCKLAGQRMLFEIDGDACRHIPADSPDYAMILPRLQSLTCSKCGKRILDYFQVVGESWVEAKCVHDGHPDIYPIG